MTKVTADMTITLDGCASGRGQSRERPFGDLEPERLHAWMFDHSPFVAGGGERVFADTAGLELTPASSRTTPHVTHLVYRR